MRPMLLALAFVVGTMLALHLSMNAAVGKTVGNPRMGNAVFWVIGAAMAVAIGLTRWQGAFWTEAAKVRPWLWSAGVIGACLVFAIAALIPRLGAGTTNTLLVSGQVIGAMIIAHYGALGSPVERISWMKVLGVAVMVLGASVAVRGRFPFL